MTTSKSLVIQNGTTKQIPDADTLNVGAGIDGAGASLAIGSATTTTITIGDPLGGSTTVFPGPVQLDGDVNTVAGTTFTTSATFEGNVTFGTGVAPDETVTFNGATISSDIAFTSPGYRVTNMLDPLAAQDAATKAYADTKLALTGGTMSGAINMGSQKITSLANGTAATDAINLSQLQAVQNFEYDEEIFVAPNGSDGTGTGAVLNPFATVRAAIAAITDATPTKRYAIRVTAGAYSESTITGTATSGGAATLTDSSKAWYTNILAGTLISITGGTGSGQTRTIASNTADTLTVSAAWTTPPDGTSTYSITQGALNIKPNVFIVGTMKDSVRITAPSFGLDASWNAGSGVDNRSGFAQVTLLGAATFNFATVTSSAGKLYCQSVSFANAVSLTGYNAINQAQFDSCVFFGAFSNTAVNVGVHTNNVHFSNISLTQHASLPTLLVATGGYCGGNITATTTVNDFNRRCSLFLRSFPSENLTVDGPSSYADFTIDSGSKNGATAPNGGNLVPMNAIVSQRIAPVSTNTYNMGDWGKQWFFAFNYCNFSTGTELYVGTVDSVYDPAGSTAGYDVWIQPDQYGLQANVNGGKIDLRTASGTGTGTSGNVDVSTGATVNGNSGSITLTTGTPTPSSTTIAAGSNGQVLPQATINVAGATAFPSAGTILVVTDAGTQTVTYTGTTATSFTGCAGGTGTMSTGGAVTFSVTRGVISLDGREIDANSVKITNLANGTNPNDAVNYSQLSAIVSGVSAVTATAPLLSSGGATPDISIDTAGASAGDVLTYNGAAWAAAAPATTAPGTPLASVQFNSAGSFAGSDQFVWDGVKVRVNSAGLIDQSWTDIDGGAVTTNQDAAGAFGPAGQGSLSPGLLYLQDADVSQTIDLDATNSKLLASAAFNVEAASSVTATITGGATYLLTPNSVQTGFATSGALTFDLDPSLTPYKQVGALTGDISLANASNPGAARSITVEIIGDTVSRNVTSVPAGWTWLGGSAPTVVPANATVILSLACFGSSNNDVVASWSYDGSTAVTDVTATAPLLSSGGATPNLSIDTAGASAGDVLTYDGSAWAAAAIPAGTDYSVVTLTTAQAANTAVTVAGAAAQANSASTSRVAGIVTATNTVKVLGICTCDVEGALSIAAGDVVFLSASEAGAVTNVAPSASGEVVAELGIATAASSGGTVAVLWQPKSITVL